MLDVHKWPHWECQGEAIGARVGAWSAVLFLDYRQVIY